MYLYFDKNGTLKEQITIPVRTGDENGEVNSIYVYWDTDKTIKLGTCCKFRMANGEYYTTGGSPIIPATKLIDDLQIPYDQNRDLKFFKYNTTYPFIKFTIPADVLTTENENNDIVPVVNSVLFSSYILYENENQEDEVKALTMVAFAVEPTLLSVAQDQNINIAQWYELLREIQKAIEMVENGVTTNTDQTITSVKTFRKPIRIIRNNDETSVFFSLLYRDLDESSITQYDIKASEITDDQFDIALPNANGTLALEEYTVDLSSNQNIEGNKTFKNAIKFDTTTAPEATGLDGYNTDLYWNNKKIAIDEDVVKIVGTQAITGDKTFANGLSVGLNGAVAFTENYEAAPIITAEITDGNDTTTYVIKADVADADVDVKLPKKSGTLAISDNGTFNATSADNDFVFNVGTDYEGIYLLKYGRVIVQFAIVGLTENTSYTFSGALHEDPSDGDPSTGIYDVKYTNSTLVISSDDSGRLFVDGINATLIRLLKAQS